MINTLIRHSDRVKIAALAQLVNVIAPILTIEGGSAYAQTIYYPFKYASLYGRGEAIMPKVNCPTYNCKKFENVKQLDVSAVYNKEGEYLVIVANTSRENTTETEIIFDKNVEIVEHAVMENDNMLAENTFENPFNIIPQNGISKIEKNKICFTSKHAGVNILRVKELK